MKKIIAIILALAMLSLMTACQASPTGTAETSSTETKEPIETPEPTPTLPNLDNESITISDLGDYTIVYPSAYTDIRMDMPTMLADNIERVTGKRPQIKSDEDCSSGKRIILASGTTQTVFSGAVSRFEDSMTYLIAVFDENLILGGQNYYADANAIYDFINNYLGYDDVEEQYSEAEEEVAGLRIKYHEKPNIFIGGSTWNTDFVTAKQIKVLADANFNFLMYTYYSADLHNIIKWCARFGVYVVLNRGISMQEIYYDCPIIVGHNVWDEPNGEEEIKTAMDLLDKYHSEKLVAEWKGWVNDVGTNKVWDNIDEMWLWEGRDITGFDIYPFVSHYRYFQHLHFHELSRQSATIHGEELWYYIQSYDRINDDEILRMNSDKDYRWQLYYSMCFDPDNLIYFMYCSVNGTGEWADNDSYVINRDLVTKEANYYAALRANREILDIADIIADLDYKGANTVNRSDDSMFTYLESPYEYAYLIENITGFTTKDCFLLGFYENDSDAAFIFTNMSDPDEGKYDDTEIKYIKAKIKGTDVSVYRDGKTEHITPDADGYYSIPTGNGIGCLVRFTKN